MINGNCCLANNYLCYHHVWLGRMDANMGEAKEWLKQPFRGHNDQEMI